jgi:phosphoserine phosphatase
MQHLPTCGVLVRLLNITPQEVERIIAGAAKAKQRSGMAQGMASVANVGSSAADIPLMGLAGEAAGLAAASSVAAVAAEHGQQPQRAGPSYSSFSNR